MPVVRLEPWTDGDLALNEQLLKDPAITAHLGGPHSDDQIAQLHARQLRLAATGTGRMFKIINDATGEAVGSVGYWERTWRDETVYEAGWLVLPAFHRRGIASAATALALRRAREDRKHRFVHAFPVVDNAPSNAICRK